MFYTYVLRSKRNGRLYIGFTSNLKKRFKEHNSGLVPSTKNGCPWTLKYYEACCKIESAVKREKVLKTGFGRSYIKNRIA